MTNGQGLLARPAPGADNAGSSSVLQFNVAGDGASRQGGFRGNGKAFGTGDRGGAKETYWLECGERKPAPRI